MEWISVKDRLPDDDKTVLVTDGIRICLSYYEGCCDLWRGGYIFGREMTHWMPLPQPPKEK